MTMRACRFCGTVTELVLCPLCDEEALEDVFDEYEIDTDKWNEDDWWQAHYEKQMERDDD